MRGPGKFVAALLASFTLLALMAPSGGIPSRPRFQAATVTGRLDLGVPTQTDLSSTLLITDATPRVTWYESDAAASNRRWDAVVGSEQFLLRAPTDTNNTATTWLSVDRTGGTIDSINLQATSVQVNGVPVFGSVFAASAATGSSRASNTTTTCDSELTINLPNVTARYALEALVSFSGGGITANGWKVRPLSSAGTVSIGFWDGYATSNTSTANASPTANESSGVPAGFTAPFNTAGVPTRVHVSGVFTVTSGSPPAVCIAWAQNSSNATATSIDSGSWVKATRLN